MNEGRAAQSRFMRVLNGEALARPPVWLMRQAGRYLPEYRELRAKAPNFLSFCYNPANAAEVTLQPIRRFGFDAAIIFSDILVVPDALGQQVSFEAGEGPRLAAIEEPAHLARIRDTLDLGQLAPVYEAIERVKGALSPDTALIGFCGAPWTVATYMIAGRGTPDQAPARTFRLQASRHIPEADRHSRAGLDRASVGADPRRGRRGADLRLMGWRAARSRTREMDAGPHRAHRAGHPRGPSPCARSSPSRAA